MALPTTPRYWTNRKELYEEAIVRQRNQDHDFRQKWAETAEYFRKSNVLAAKQNEWTSGKYQNKCFDKFKNSCERDLKAIKLRRRQEQLRSLLLEETMLYEAELKRLSRDNYFHVEEMKERAEGLRSSREEKRKQVADQKLYEHWQLNNPDIRKVQSELMKEQVVDHWSQQQEEAKQREEQERQEKEELERQMEEERLAAVKHAQQKEEERHKEEIELQEHLRQQMTELKLQEVEAKELKHQHDLLLQEQWEMERLEAQRQRKEEQRKKLALGRALLHQHKTQMMHKSKVIQEELEQDRLLLEEMIRREQEDLSLRTARREKAKADAEWMKQVIEDQLRLEKSREAEMDMLFQDEAARMWQQREGEWERERRARQRLMDEVLTVRQQQIAEKIEEVKRRQQESLDRREELLKELEISNQLTQREQEKIQAEQVAIKHDLKEQIGEHQNIEKLAKLNLKEEEEQEQKADAEYQNFVQQETDRMRQQGYTPRVQSSLFKFLGR